MHFDTIEEWHPASFCSIDSIDGSIEAVGGGGGFGNNGNANGAADSLGGGYATTANDALALGSFGLGIAAGGTAGASSSTIALGATSVLGLDATNQGALSQAMIDVAHDMSLGLGTAVTANPSYSMYLTAAGPADPFATGPGSDNYMAFPGSQ